MCMQGVPLPIRINIDNRNSRGLPIHSQEEVSRDARESQKKPCHLRVRPAKPLGGSHFLRKFSVLFSHFLWPVKKEQ